MHLLGGHVDWAGLPIVFELLGVVDVERTIAQMLVIQDCRAKRQSRD